MVRLQAGPPGLQTSLRDSLQLPLPCKTSTRRAMSESKSTKRLFDFIHESAFDDLSDESVVQAKRCLLDFLGNALVGSTTETGRQMRDFLGSSESGGKVTAIGFGGQTDVLRAALVNGTIAHALDLDDGERRSTVHGGSPIVSAALAAAEESEVDGRQLLTAIVAGYEAALRIGRAVQPSHRNRGFHATATCGTFGAAVAAAKVYGLSRTALTSAVGFAGTNATGLLQFLEDGSQIKHFHPGKAAMQGVLAAQLASSGLSGSPDILEGKRGFLRAFTDEFTLANLTEGLGEGFVIADVYFKPYAACRHCHAPIEAALSVAGQHSLAPESIRVITVKTYKAGVDGHIDPAPQTVVGAKMSTPYSVAVALKTGFAGPAEFSPEAYSDPATLSLAAKVTVVEDPEMTRLVPGKRPAEVLIEAKNGGAFSCRVDLPKGEPENPMDDAALETKFSGLAASCRSVEQVREIIAAVKHIETSIDALYPLIK